ncbi:MAG: hypothetical protein WC466_05740 [Candidatus Izemoplasmatales bacterium]
MKRFVVFVVLMTGVSLFFALRAQTTDTLSVDTLSKKMQSFSFVNVTNHNVWRATLMDQTGLPHIQPSFGILKNNFEIGIIGSYNILGSYFETDIYAFYSLGMANITVTDFYIMQNLLGNYLDYSNNHHIVADFSFLVSEKIPIEFKASTILNSSWDKDISGKRKFTTYFETKYFKNEWEFFVGVLSGHSEFYLNNDKDYGPNIINVGVLRQSSIEFNESSFPVTTQFCINPQKEKAYLTVIVTF